MENKEKQKPELHRYIEGVFFYSADHVLHLEEFCSAFGVEKDEVKSAIKVEDFYEAQEREEEMFKNRKILKMFKNRKIAEYKSINKINRAFLSGVWWGFWLGVGLILCVKYFKFI